MVKLSVIVPVYNVEKYVSECLESLMNQDLSKDEYEVICVDDGSSDNSLEVLKEYEKKYPNIRVYTQENSGVCVSRNRGIELAKGEYVWFNDSDDFIYPNCLKALYEVAKSNNLDQLYFNLKQVGIDLTYADFIKNLPPFKVDNYREFASTEEKNSVIRRQWSVITFIKLSVLKEHNIRFVKGATMAEELAFNYFVGLYVKRCAYVNVTPYYYRTYREGSATCSYDHNEKQLKRYIGSRIALADFYNQKIKEYKGNKKVVKDLKKMRLFDVQGALSLTLSLGKKEYTKEIIKTLKDKGLYPYCSISNIIPKESLRKTFINYVALFYPFSWYLKLLTIFSKGRKYE